MKDHIAAYAAPRIIVAIGTLGEPPTEARHLYRFREGMTRKGDSQGGVLVIHRGAWFRGGVSHASLADPDGYQRARTSTPCQAREKPASGAAPAGDRQRAGRDEPRAVGAAGGHGSASAARLGDPLQRRWARWPEGPLGRGPAHGGERRRSGRRQGDDPEGSVALR